MLYQLWSGRYDYTCSAVGIWTIDPSDVSCINPTLSISVVNFWSNYTIFVEREIVGTCVDEFSATSKIEFSNCSGVNNYALSPSIISKKTNIMVSLIIKDVTSTRYRHSGYCQNTFYNLCDLLLVYDFLPK